MAQGSINMPGYQPAQAGAVLAALQAVHQFYGINTEKQQQELLAAQTKAADQANERAAYEFKQYKDWFGDEQPNQPVSGEAAPGIGTTAGAAAGISPLGSLMNHASNKKIPPFALDYMEKQQKLHNSQIEGQIKEGEAAAQPQKIQRENAAPFVATTNAFNEAAKADRATIQGANQISKLATSGIKGAGQLGQASIAMLTTGVKRFSDELQKMAGAPDTISHFKNIIGEKTSGFQTPEELHAINQMANLVGSAAAAHMDQLASDHAASASPALGVSANAIKSKYLLPNGPGFQPTQTQVMGGKLYIRKGNKGVPVNFGD